MDEQDARFFTGEKESFGQLLRRRTRGEGLFADTSPRQSQVNLHPPGCWLKPLPEQGTKKGAAFTAGRHSHSRGPGPFNNWRPACSIHRGRSGELSECNSCSAARCLAQQLR